MDFNMVIKALLVAGSLIVGLAARYWWQLPADHPVEEVAEEIIEQQTGQDIDFSPDE